MIDKQLIPISVETTVAKIEGFVGLPENARKRGALQFLFVNGRNMRHPYFAKAVLTCYDKLIAPDVQPNYFLNFTVDPATIDVNIHPTKNEIKFENEQPIWQILVAAIKESLGRFNAVPSIDFDVDDTPEIPVFNPNSSAIVDEGINNNYNPFATNSANTQTKFGSINNIRKKADNWEQLYENFNNKSVAIETQTTFVPDLEFPADSTNDKNENESDAIFQLKNKYIVTPAASGLMIVDQHRAHTLVLFHEYMDAMKSGGFSTQQVLFPEVINLSPSQNIILESISEGLQEIGFDISFLGDNSWTINGYPSVLGTANPNETLHKMIEAVSNGSELTDEDIKVQTALAMAQAAAIPSGKQLTTKEMDYLLNRLLTLPAPGFTPTGLNIITLISTEEIVERMSR